MTTTTAPQLLGKCPAPGDVRLSHLHATGELIDSYTAVPELLAGLDEAALLRAGTVLSQVHPDALLRRHPGLPEATVAITGSSTIRPMVSPLSAQLARHGFVPRIQVGGYGQYAIELRETHNELFATEPDVTVCLLDADAVFQRLRTPWTPADVRYALRQLSSHLEEITDAYQAKHTGTLVFNTVPLPWYWASQLIDHCSRALLGATWREFNAHLLTFSTNRPGVLAVDTEPLLGETGALADPRASSYANVHFSDEFFSAYAREIGHVVRSLTGRAGKCLVIDLDGTLWGGNLADDGPDGIEISEGFRGEAFHAFQTAVKQLSAQGVLVAVCSKNDEDEVLEVFKQNPELALGADDIVAMAVNWGAKPGNLAEIADKLGIDVNSLVFVDDSAAERGVVRDALPAVPVIAVDADEPALHVRRLLADRWFVTDEITQADRTRVQRYLTDRKRVKLREEVESKADYLAGLGTTVELFDAGHGNAGRVAQLTQRTNRFNLTADRLDTAAVLELIAGQDTEVIAVRCTDRFGEYGTIGAIFTRRRGPVLHIDNFVLSCRVLARDVETACLRAILRQAARAGATKVTAAFRLTGMNDKVKDFYPLNGFTADPDAEDDDTGFSHDLSTVPPNPPHLELVVRLSERLGDRAAE
ncbi:HAD family hydrolase [Amycolatopsis sp. EV170708-02-1]|uniref:HAD-IIIC family phosphatase n=1 Tax=Amycolatopsis sp. EV170708-02-1 TaxID=2919322 RepID=UPI001F0C9188|nr:HAD-IIIC family phosphatase [Amycolatopsis sp. EV170708-02-1]UMP06807.1 HAD-IIIC family phosphatase [Amycolatopsis sp. EV170708-02-1]